MKVYLVYSESMGHILRRAKCRILYSYAYRSKFQTKPRLPTGFPEILIDSGAFSLITGRSTPWEVNLDGYGLWLELVLTKHPEVVGYFNLDCYTNDPKQNLKNQLRLEARGLKPIPVWHVGEDVEFLDLYCGKYEIVGIGGPAWAHLSIARQVRTWNWLTQRYPGQKFHWFGAGLSALKIFTSFRPYSTDNSSWVSPAKFGRGVRNGRVVILPLEDRQRIREDKSLKEEELLQMVRYAMELESEVEMRNEPYQLILPL